METSKFWKLIDKSRRAADGDLEDFPEILKDELIQLSNEEIIAFDQLFYEFMNNAYAWDLWGVAYIIGGGCSDDSFMDFRAWLIGKGQKAYETGLVNPDHLTRFIKEQDVDIDCQLEDLLYAAPRAWEEKTGQDLPVRTLSNIRTEPTGTDWGGDDQNLSKRLPKIWKRFWNE